MTNSVRNNDRPTSTWFGGVCGVPSAWRRIASTITIRVNAVIESSSAGSTVSAVISASTWMLSE